ncbi:MAG: class I SAM-dependent methyltransferase [Anaerolineales bacterium]|nr:class I SAM-dependent methyltransferase [Anaerolineales bacterium]
MPLKPEVWHERYCQQARWTQSLRLYLFERYHLEQSARVLEVGCGTGALLSAIEPKTEPFSDLDGPSRPVQAAIHGLDLNLEYLELAHSHSSSAILTQGDAHSLPYASGSFDLTFCHFLLLWLNSPVEAVAEMGRVTRPGGAVLALAEPDYGGRIDYPSDLNILGVWQKQALMDQGAVPLIGRQLAEIFLAARLKDVEYGVLGGEWQARPDPQESDAEWRILLDDLDDRVDPTLLEELHQLDRDSRRLGERVLFVPTFYACGRV